ncbi:MAG TPA: alpha/beta hydrolase [Bacteroidales bacterium]
MATCQTQKINYIIVLATLLSNMAIAQETSFCINLRIKEAYIPPVEKNFDVNKSYTPYIKVFLPSKEKATGRAVLIFPGGGYGMVAFGHEGTRWAGYFNDLGIAAIVVKYGLPHGNAKIPVTDAETAFQIVKDSAQAWHLNQNNIGVMGFSAGGHLASTIATHAQSPLRPSSKFSFIR